MGRGHPPQPARTEEWREPEPVDDPRELFEGQETLTEQDEIELRSELARLCGSAAELLRAMPADLALRTWMDRFIDYRATKHGMAEALRAVIASGGDPFAQSRESLTAAVTTLLAAGAADGSLRGDVAPADILASLSGLSLAAGAPDQRDQAGRLLDLLLDGLRRAPGDSLA